MTQSSWIDFCNSTPVKLTPSSITVGVFDGLHIGHRRLIAETTSMTGVRATVFTFLSSPRSVVGSGDFPGYLTSYRQKMERLEVLGINDVVVIDFSSIMGKLSGAEFFQIIMDRLELRRIVLGSNHRLGRNREMGAREITRLMEPMGVEVVSVDRVGVDGDSVSSTRIRSAVQVADFTLVQKLLGVPFSLDFRDLPAKRDGDLLSIPVEAITQVLPPPGTYRVGRVLNSPDGTTQLWITLQEVTWIQPEETPVGILNFHNKLA